MGKYIRKILIPFFIIGSFFYILIYFFKPADSTMLEAIRLYVSPGRKYLIKGIEEIGSENYGKAIEYLEKSEKRDPWMKKYTILPWTLIAYGYRDERRYDEAINIYKKITRIDPRNGEALFYLGRCYKDKGETEKATKEWTRCINISPNSKWAIRAKRRILKLKGQDKKVEK